MKISDGQWKRQYSSPKRRAWQSGSAGWPRSVSSKRALLVGGAALTLALSGLFAQAGTLTAALAADGDPFPDTGGAGRVWVSLGTSNATLFEGKQVNDFFAVDPLQDPPGPYYNAVGFNVNDRYIYAISARSFPDDGGRHLYRIGQGGVIVDLGPIDGLPDFFNGFGYFAGSFGKDETATGGQDTSNILFIAASNGNSQGQTVYSVDVTTQTVVQTNVVISGGSQGSFNDFMYAHGYLWSIRSGTQTLSRFDLSNNTQLDIDLSSLDFPATGWAALWVYGNGNFGAADVQNNLAMQFRVNDPSSNSPTVEIIAKSTLTTSSTAQDGDGTSDPGLPTDLGIVKSGPPVYGPGGTITWTMTVTNHGPTDSSGWVMRDVIPQGLLNPTTPNSRCIIEVKNGQNLLTCVGDELAAFEDAPPITLTATVPAGWNTSSSPDGAQCYGALTNIATVLGNEEDPNPDNDSSSAEACPRSLSWLKVAAADPNKLLAGSTWRVTGPNGFSLGVTDNVGQNGYQGPDLDPTAGQFRVSLLSDGDYSLVEIAAPFGYVRDVTPHLATIDTQHVGVHLGKIENRVRTEALAATGDASYLPMLQSALATVGLGLLILATARRKLA